LAIRPQERRLSNCSSSVKCPHHGQVWSEGIQAAVLASQEHEPGEGIYDGRVFEGATSTIAVEQCATGRETVNSIARCNEDIPVGMDSSRVIVSEGRAGVV